MLTWTPDPADTPWAEVQEDEVWIETAITAADDSLGIISYSAEVLGDPLLVGLVVTASTGGVLVSATDSLVGSFPVIDIEYQIKGVTGHCKHFADIPTDADELIRYQPNPASLKEWLIRVTATLDDNSTASADFVLKVHANFTPGNSALKEAVNARRH